MGAAAPSTVRENTRWPAAGHTGSTSSSRTTYLLRAGRAERVVVEHLINVPNLSHGYSGCAGCAGCTGGAGGQGVGASLDMSPFLTSRMVMVQAKAHASYRWGPPQAHTEKEGVREGEGASRQRCER